MPTAPFPWQHLAEEYRVLGRAADANRAAARAQQLGAGAAKSSKKKA
jgi:hypothetical protein